MVATTTAVTTVPTTLQVVTLAGITTVVVVEEMPILRPPLVSLFLLSSVPHMC
jgi:hypothetical protein